jgi:hypothetical protein
MPAAKEVMQTQAQANRFRANNVAHSRKKDCALRLMIQLEASIPRANSTRTESPGLTKEEESFHQDLPPQPDNESMPEPCRTFEQGAGTALP